MNMRILEVVTSLYIYQIVTVWDQETRKKKPQKQVQQVN